MKKHTRLFILALLMTFLAAMPVYAAQWHQDTTGWWYEQDNGTYPAGKWELINGQWYNFNQSGYMQTGWVNSNGVWYYCLPSGEMVHDTTMEIDGVSYTFQSDGAWVQPAGNQTVENQTVSITKAQAEQWFYATYAMIANENEWNRDYFLSVPGQWQGEAKYRLKLAWGITDRATADETISWLLNSGHRSEYQLSMELLLYLGYFNRSDEEIREDYKNDEAALDLVLLYKHGGVTSIDAWDYCRAMQVIRECYLAGYYTEQEELDQMLAIAKIIQNTCSSWDEMAESYLRGYEYWSDSADNYRYRKNLYEQLKRDTSYYLVDWNLPLGKAW